MHHLGRELLAGAALAVDQHVLVTPRRALELRSNAVGARRLARRGETKTGGFLLEAGPTSMGVDLEETEARLRLAHADGRVASTPFLPSLHAFARAFDVAGASDLARRGASRMLMLAIVFH